MNFSDPSFAAMLKPGFSDRDKLQGLENILTCSEQQLRAIYIQPFCGQQVSSLCNTKKSCLQLLLRILGIAHAEQALLGPMSDPCLQHQAPLLRDLRRVAGDVHQTAVVLVRCQPTTHAPDRSGCTYSIPDQVSQLREFEQMPQAYEALGLQPYACQSQISKVCAPCLGGLG